MKVLLINTVCGTGSTGRIVVDLCNELKKQNHDCVIAFGRGNAPENIKAIKIGNRCDVYRHVIYSRVFDKAGFGSVQATYRLISKIKEYDPDVIHLHNLHGYYINIEILFKYLKKLNKPVFWTLHDCWAFTGHCAYFDFANCEKWKSQCIKCPQKKAYPSALIFDNSAYNYAKKKELFASINNMTIITPSKWLGRLVKESFLSNYEVRIINNGIDLDVFKPVSSDFRQRHKIENRTMLLGVASVWDMRKGLNDFIDLAYRLDDKYKIVLVGVDDKQKRRLPQNITAISRTNNVNELAEIYSAADIFINPTHEDNFPTTNLEALACGTPVITYRTGGSPEAIDKTCGIIVEQRNISALCDAIKDIEGRNIPFEDCCIRAHRYNKEIKYQEYLSLYEGAVKEHQPQLVNNHF